MVRCADGAQVWMIRCGDGVSVDAPTTPVQYTYLYTEKAIENVNIMHRLSGNVTVQGPLKLNYFREPSFFNLFLVFFFQQGERTYLFVHILLHILGSRRFGDHQNKIILENLPFSIFFQYFSFNRVKEPISLYFFVAYFGVSATYERFWGPQKLK